MVYTIFLHWVFLCDTVLCTVRESSSTSSSTFHQVPAIQNGGMSYTFELLSPNHKKPIVLQARSPIEYKLWVGTIRRSMEAKLEASKLESVYVGSQCREGHLEQQFQTEETISRHNSSMIRPDDFHLHYISSATTSLTGISQAESCILRILQSNPYCSECRTVNPEWVSLNLCVVFCKECSGIHRSLGVHCSKVRSLKLDSLTPSECQLILALGGNDKINSEIWEAGLPLGINDAINNIYDYTKPTPNSSWEEKNRWIQAKYKGKEFLGMPGAAFVSSSPPTLCSLESECTNEDVKDENSNKDNQKMEYSVNLALYTASQQGNLMDIAKALVHGADVHWKNPSNSGETPLHTCMRGNPTHRDSDTFQPECAELLLQYGAKLDAIDDKTQTVWDVCSHMAIEFLESRKRKS
jgi:Putative GTPase activating protein for Arf/Ankyrin repeat